MKLICPRDSNHTSFTAVAYREEIWSYDEWAKPIKKIHDQGVRHRHPNSLVWRCLICGEEAEIHPPLAWDRMEDYVYSADLRRFVQSQMGTNPFSCPICDQIVQEKIYTLDRRSAFDLITLISKYDHDKYLKGRSISTEFFSPRRRGPSHMKFWGLIKEDDSGGKNRGLYVPTDSGRHFVHNRITANRMAVTYRAILRRFDGNQIGIHDLLTKEEIGQGLLCLRGEMNPTDWWIGFGMNPPSETGLLEKMRRFPEDRRRPRK